MDAIKINNLKNRISKEFNDIMKSGFDDLTDEKIYNQHANLLVECGNLMLAKEFKKFVVDDKNKKVLRFLTYYFNNCKLAEEVFPNKNYKIHKNIMLSGEVGAGKSMIMQVFSKYLELTNNPNRFFNLSTTQMVNYYKLHNHLDKYTYNEEGSKNFEGNPVNVCLNDIGLQTHVNFGTDTKILTIDFFHARNEIWANHGKFAHTTTNLTKKELMKYYEDEYGRIEDRFKTYNNIEVSGNSRR